MPEDNFEEKTESATPRRREEAREKGQVAKSVDLSSAFMLLAALIAFYFFGSGLIDDIFALTKSIFSHLDVFTINKQNISSYAFIGFYQIMKHLLPIILFIFVAGLFINFAQIGVLFTAEPLTPDINKLNPITGITRMFSIKSLVKLIVSILKIAVITTALYLTLIAEKTHLFDLTSYSVMHISSYILTLCFKLGMIVAIILIILAILDYGYQKWQHEKDLMMSKQEIKDELKRFEGDPKIKERRRAIQRQLALQRMMAEVPKATVVITNPTEIAIAIRYDEEMPAPIVCAKGKGLIAERIKKIADDNEIPLKEDKPLARTLYKIVEVGKQIPPELYKAVAEVLAYVYKLKEKVA